MKFSDTVTKAIELATKIRDFWSIELPKRHPDYPAVSPTEDSGPPPSEEDELRALLNSLPEEEIYKLVLIMYLGRGDFESTDLAGQYECLKERFQEPKWAVSQMLGKAPLADYLSDGVRHLEDNGIDLDSLTLSSANSRSS